jgi:hypothetical protein
MIARDAETDATERTSRIVREPEEGSPGTSAYPHEMTPEPVPTFVS